MASRIKTKILKDKAVLVEDAFFGLDRVIKRTEQYGINLHDFEILQQAHVLLGRISLNCDADLKKEELELKKYLKQNQI